jgi:eukaryotic-like serine/threonine-protein kinase
MRFCENCGHRLDNGSSFCTNCGTAVTSTPAGKNMTNARNAEQPVPPMPLPNATPTTPPAAAPANPSQTAVPQPQQTTAPSNTSAPEQTSGAGGLSAPEAITNPIKPARKKLVITLVAAVMAVIVAAGAIFGTYKAEWWGGKTLPKPTELGIAKSAKTHEFSADDVAKSLHQKGFKTTTKTTFSGKPKGSFISYNGAETGQRYNTNNNPLTIVASAGPGVPKGTQGTSAESAERSLKAMDVPVHYHTIIVSEGSKAKPGTVIMTSPADGEPVADPKAGINVGIASRGTGVGYDVLGADKDDAEQQYKNLGFDVTMKPRFSSKAKIGKIVDSYPKPGTEADGGTLILYYGIDASGFRDAVSSKNVLTAQEMLHEAMNDNAVVGSAAPVAGKYCTHAGECIDFSPEIKPTLENGFNDTALSTSEEPQHSRNNGSVSNPLIFCSALQQAECVMDKSSNPKALYTQDSGAFELIPHDWLGAYNCGDKLDIPGPASTCVAGQVTPMTPSDYDNPKPLTGATYEMGPLYVYFPVGSDISKVIDSGYFDKNEVAKAKKQKEVDASRPFFIRRDKKLYDKTSVPISSIRDSNPFAPSFADKLYGSKNALEPVKPAPSDETAYYLVEDALDWDSLPAFDINSTKADAKDKSDDKTKSDDDNTDNTDKKDAEDSKDNRQSKPTKEPTSKQKDR